MTPSAAKAGFIARIYVRPEGRTLQKTSFFREPFSRAAKNTADEGFSP
jgi:hypothetical protein